MPPEVAVSLARRAVRLAIAAISALALATAAAAAQTTATIRGTVTDAAGSALPGVVVTASASGMDTEGVTNADGAFAFADLAAGDYILTATLFGYASRELRVTVRAGAVEVVTIVLQPFFQLDPISVVAD